jgi:outer membrane protein assembly factor BamB
MKPFFLTIALILSNVVANAAFAQGTSDWPQILGPNRNGVSNEEAKLGWNGKPKVVWEKEIGQGFSGPVIANDQLIIFHRPRGVSGPYLFVEKLNASDGSQIWERKIITEFRGGMDGDAGPKATPVIDNGFVYCYGSGGELFCLDFETGEVVWQVSTQEKFNAQKGYFGRGSTPIVVDGKVLLNVGGRHVVDKESKQKGSARKYDSIIAFDAKTGEVLWKAVDDTAGYSSPIVVEHGGKKLAIFLTRLRFVGVDPDNGEVAFSNPFGKKGPSAVGSMPVAFESKVFVNAAYQVGSMVIDLDNLNDGKEAEPVWSDKTAFASHYGTPVFHKGYLYGTSGREDMRNGSFRCIEAATGKVVWEKKSFPVAHTLMVGGQLLVLDFEGKLSIVEPTPISFRLVKSTQASKTPARAVPAFSNGLLFFRNNADRRKGKLFALDVTQ